MTPASSQVLRVASSHRETCTSPMCAVPMSSMHRRALADAAAHGQGQLAIQQHLVEGERAAVVAAGDRQLGVEGLGVDADTHGRDLERMAEHFVPVEDIAVELPIVIVGGAAVVLDAGL